MRMLLILSLFVAAGAANASLMWKDSARFKKVSRAEIEANVEKEQAKTQALLEAQKKKDAEEKAFQERLLRAKLAPISPSKEPLGGPADTNVQAKAEAKTGESIQKMVKAISPEQLMQMLQTQKQKESGKSI